MGRVTRHTPPSTERIPSTAFLPAVHARLRRYGLHVIGNRAIPDGRDGLKPVSRRAVWAAYELGATGKGKEQTTGRVVGDTFGKYHPHGDAAIAKAIATMAQGVSAMPLFHGIGNFGNYALPASAPRYTTCYLTGVAMSMLDPDEVACTEFVPNYDDTQQEPLFLPSPIPYILMPGVEGVAYGVSTKTPPHSRGWVFDALRRTVDGRGLVAPKQFPFRWGGVMVDSEGDWLGEGKLRGTFRPTVSAQRDSRTLVLTSLVPGRSVDELATRIKKVPEVVSFNQVNLGWDGDIETFVTSFRRGTDYDAACAAVCDQLYSTASYNFMYILRRGDGDFTPMQTGVEPFLQDWVQWRSSFVAKVARYREGKLLAKARRAELFVKLIDNRDAYFKALKAARTLDGLHADVRRILKCSLDDAKTVLAAAQQRLSSLDKSSLLREVAEAKRAAKVEADVVKSPQNRLLENARASLAAA